MSSNLNSSQEMSVHGLEAMVELKHSFKPGEVTVFSSDKSLSEIAMLVDRVTCGDSESLEMAPRIFEIDQSLDFSFVNALQVFSAQGISEDRTLNLLSQIGMREKAADSLVEMTAFNKLRVKILLASNSAFPVILANFNGLDLSREELAIIAEDIRSGAQSSKKIVVCYGLDKRFPAAWGKASNVRVVGSGKAGELLLGSKNIGDASEAEVDFSELDEPISVPREEHCMLARALNATKLNNEAIPNLGMVAHLQDLTEDEDLEIVVNKRRPSSRDLTKVDRSGFSRFVTKVLSWFSKV